MGMTGRTLNLSYRYLIYEVATSFIGACLGFNVRFQKERLEWIQEYNLDFKKVRAEQRITTSQKQPSEVFYKKKMFLKISQNSQENSCARVSFLIKLQVSEHLFYETPLDDCFWQTF